MIHQQNQVEWKPFSLTYITYPSTSSFFIGEFLALLSLLPPFVIVSLVTAVVFYKDVIAAYLLVGCLFSSVFTSILKNRIIKEERPPRYDSTEEEIEYGMPSNHSSFAFFCATFVILYILRGGGSWAMKLLPSYKVPGQVSTAIEKKYITTHYKLIYHKLWFHLHNLVTILVSLLLAIGCAYSRVFLGYHTTKQVYAGSILGILLGVMWYALFETKIVRCILIWLDEKMYDLERVRKGFSYYLNDSRDSNEVKKQE